jgi:SnoaL-like domain
MKNIIQQYLDDLRAGDAEKIVRLFSDDAIVHSPLYGDVLAKYFFRRFFKDTIQSEITLLNIFSSLDDTEVYAAYFRFRWILKNGAVTSFECMNIFQFNGQAKIKDMSIIYDTDIARQGFESLD